MDIRAMAVYADRKVKVAEEITISNELKPLQDFVGGLIECVDMGSGVDTIVNEEGILLELPLTLYYDDNFALFGNVLFVSHDDEGEFVSLTDQQVKLIKNFVKICNESYFRRMLNMEGSTIMRG